MSANKVQMIQVANQELYVFGKLISRHPEMPWLFSITDVYKACEKPIKNEAKKYGKDPEVTYKSKRPGVWTQCNTGQEVVEATASKLRKRIVKYGINCGFAACTDNQPRASVQSKTGSDRDMVIKVVKGGSTKGSNKVAQGTYVCQNWIVQYAALNKMWR